MPKTFYTEEMDCWLRKNVPNTRFNKVTELFNQKFGTDLKITALRSHCTINKIYNGLPRCGDTPKNKLFTQEQEKFVASIVKNSTYRKITDAVNEKFNLNIKIEQIKTYMSKHHLKTGTFGNRYKKGHVPENKGKKMSPEVYEKVKATMFKKGNIPPNHRKVGDMRLNIYGCYEIKTAEPNKWTLYHRYIWEQKHGPVPDNYVVIHLDGNLQNNSIENLKCISRRSCVYMNYMKGWSDNPEITGLSSDIAKLKTVIKDKRSKK